MTHKESIVLLTMVVAAMLPLPAAIPGTTGAPVGAENTRYCLRVDPITGSRIETIQCKTRDEWAQLDVDVDQEWAANGVGVVA
jgi:hypothetical protein